MGIIDVRGLKNRKGLKGKKRKKKEKASFIEVVFTVGEGVVKKVYLNRQQEIEYRPWPFMAGIGIFSLAGRVIGFLHQ